MGNKKELSFVDGPVFGSLIRFALPVLGALILQAAYGAVDLMVVGQFGDASSIYAVGTGSTFMQMVTNVSLPASCSAALDTLTAAATAFRSCSRESPPHSASVSLCRS